MSLIVVGIFLLATFGSVSACTDGCTIVSDDKKDGCNPSNETNIKEIKNLTKEEIPMEDFEEIIKLAEEKGYEVLYDEVIKVKYDNGLKAIYIPLEGKPIATIVKFYGNELPKTLPISIAINRNRLKSTKTVITQIILEENEIIGLNFTDGKREAFVNLKEKEVTIKENGVTLKGGYWTCVAGCIGDFCINNASYCTGCAAWCVSCIGCLIFPPSCAVACPPCLICLGAPVAYCAITCLF